MAPFMTRDMLDGMDHFWRMRSHVDLAALPPQRKAWCCPTSAIWADSAAGMSGEARCSARSTSFT
jgi:aspartyl-tRNA(Asn)/glutamyl-tRNA(Gln) amidotransferase subunit A